jgi:hypothetical protein
MAYLDAACSGIGLDFDRLVICKCGAGGIGTVSVVGDQDKVAMPLALAFVIGFDQHQACKLPMRARRGLQGDASHTRDLGQVALQLVEQLDSSLHGILRLQGVDASEAWQHSHVFVKLGVVLHSTGAERVEAGVHAKIAL